MSFQFETLDVWKKIREFKKEIYAVTTSFPPEEKFGLISQIRRSAVSMSANVVEGSGRSSAADRAHYTNLSYSSTLETLDHLYTALDLNFIEQEKFNNYKSEIVQITSMLSGLYKYQLSQAKNLKDNIKRKRIE